MPRIDPTVSKEAKNIYDDIPLKERGRFVSEAIIEKHSKTKEIFTEEQMNCIKGQALCVAVQVIKELEERIKKLERMMEK